MKSILYSILLSLLTSFSFSQAKVTATFESPTNSNISFCTSSLLLDDKGYFFNEQGCEGVSNVSCGKYKINKDTLLLKYIPITDLQIVAVTDSSMSYDTMFTIQFVDRYNQPITQALKSWDFELDAVEKNGKFFKKLVFDNTGSIKLSKNKYAYIRFHKMYKFITKRQIFNLNNKNLTVHLNFPNMFMMFDSKPKPIEKAEVKLLMKKGKLYSMQKKEILFTKI